MENRDMNAGEMRETYIKAIGEMIENIREVRVIARIYHFVCRLYGRKKN